MNFIIVALLAIAVLIVLLFVFGDKVKIFTTSTANTCSPDDCKRAVDDQCSSDEAKGFAKLSSSGTNLGADYSQCQKKEGETVRCCIKIEKG